jgi:hypothetical protein
MAQTENDLKSVPGWRVLLALTKLSGNEAHQFDVIAEQLGEMSRDPPAARGQLVLWIRELDERKLIVSDGASDVWRLTFAGAQLVVGFLDAPPEDGQGGTP